MALPLSRTTHDNFYNDSKGKSPFQRPVHPSLTLLTLTSSIIALLFLSRFNRTVTDIGFLAAWLDGHVVRLGIGLKGLWKPCGNLRSVFKVHPIVDCLAIALPKGPITWLVFFEHYHWFCFAPLASSPLLHSVAHHTRLVTLWQVFYIPFQAPTWKYSLTIVSSSQ
jgi:hypothetical protein